MVLSVVSHRTYIPCEYYKSTTVELTQTTTWCWRSRGSIIVYYCWCTCNICCCRTGCALMTAVCWWWCLEYSHNNNDAPQALQWKTTINRNHTLFDTYCCTCSLVCSSSAAVDVANGSRHLPSIAMPLKYSAMVLNTKAEEG